MLLVTDLQQPHTCYLQCLWILLLLLLCCCASNFWQQLAKLTSHTDATLCLALMAVGDPFLLCLFGIPWSYEPRNVSDNGTVANILVVRIEGGLSALDYTTVSNPMNTINSNYTVHTTCDGFGRGDNSECDNILGVLRKSWVDWKRSWESSLGSAGTMVTESSLALEELSPWLTLGMILHNDMCRSGLIFFNTTE